ncbi:GyrI-like domain-containing protein [Nocardiopsis halophila]|uniref:GyrI-like domain-containing protein n=1 Tax=Nocardiopsis halophila TaxID=141692 RepID=UPI00034DB85B|nr:GyrI-like domain-containing protein [Nocardiopsis halophila]
MNAFNFNPPDTPAEAETVRSWGDTVAEFGDRITGDSGSLTSELDSGAMSFTEQISSNIKDSGEYQDDLWREVAWNLSYLKGVMERWATNIEWFKKQRQNLIDQHKTAMEQSGLIPPLQGESPDFEGKELDRYEELVDKHDELSDEAQDLWKRFKELADDRGEDLKKDPKNDLSANDVQYMVDKGYLQWAPFNIMQWTHSVPIDIDGAKGREVGQNIVEGIEDGDLAQKDYEEALLILDALGVKAAQLQADGKKLSKDEREFVDNLLAELEEVPPVPPPPGLKEDQKPPTSGGILAIPEHLRELGYTDEQVEALSGGVGNAILIASDKDLGGNGYDDLPGSVQRVVEGTDRYTSLAHWSNDVNDLASLIEGASPGLEGGTGFSAGLMNTIGVEIADNEDISRLHPETSGKSFEVLLDRASLNENANYLILTGEYESSSVGEVDTEKALEGLFTYEWEDHGEAVAGLFDWIPDFAESDDPHSQEMAGKATASFLQSIGRNDDLFSALQDTEIEVEGYENPAFTVHNSELADEMFKVYTIYLEDFGLADSGGDYGYEQVNGTAADHNPLKEPGEYELVSSLKARERYLELLVANPDAAVGVVDAANKQSQEYANSYVGAVLDEGGAQPDEWVGPSARLQASVDAALVGAFENNGSEEKQALEQTLKTRELAIKLGMNTIDLLGSPESDWGSAAHATIKGYSETGIMDVVNKDLKDEIKSIDQELKNVDLKNEGQIYLDNQYMFGNALLENDVPIPEEVSNDPRLKAELFDGDHFRHKGGVDRDFKDTYGRIYGEWLENAEGGNELSMGDRFASYDTAYDREYDLTSGIVGGGVDPLTAYRDLAGK